MSTPHQTKDNGKGYDWDDEFGCSEDTSLSSSLPLLSTTIRVSLLMASMRRRWWGS